MDRVIRWLLVMAVGLHVLGCFPVPVPVPWGHHDDDDDHHHHHRDYDDDRYHR
jgi:hypothetical protein